MNKFLQAFNFLGVLALGAMCVMGFRTNSSLHHSIDDLKKLRNEQILKIESQANTIKARDADLEELKHQLSITQAANDELTKRLAVVERDLAKTAKERDNLAAELQTWKDAVHARDEEIKTQNDLLKEAKDRINQLTADHSDDVRKFNDLVKQYNSLVKQVEESQKKDKQ